MGVIGCGGIAQHAHLPAIRRNAGAELVAVADGFEDLAAKVARRCGLEKSAAFGDYHRLLERDDVDAVAVCASTQFHAECAIAALEAGKHVLVEKPMAVTGDEARAMVAAAEKARRTLMVAYNHTYDLAARCVREMLEAGELGDLLYAEMFFYEDCGAWTAGAYNSTLRSKNHVNMWPKPRDERDQLLHFIHNMDSHVINLTRTLIGDPQGIEYSRWVPGAGFWAMLDYGSFKCCLKNVNTRQHRFEKGVELSGRKKRVRIDLAPPLERYMPGRVEIVDAEANTVTERLLDQRWPFELEHEHFVTCIREGREPLTSGARVLRDVTLAEELVAAAFGD
jgi:predicted dehydrogenase